MADFINNAAEWLINTGIRVVLIVIAAYIVLRLLKIIIMRFQSNLEKGDPTGEAGKRAQTLGNLLRTAVVIIIFTVAIIMSLSELGMQIGPIIATLGIGGLAIGFGAQFLVRDLISGFFIIMENQIRVGDVVSINDKGGVVEMITLRIVRLRDLHGVVHYIPHGQIAVVSNMTKDYGRYVFDVGIAYREDVDEVIEILKEIGDELVKDPDYRDVIVEPLEILGLDRFEDSAVVIRARITTRPIQQWRVGREFNKRMKKVFDERGIEIPFPHRTIYMGVLKDETAPPLIVKEHEDKKSKTQQSNKLKQNT
jgi:moderate conductance mechanosensitive channel